MRRSIRRQRKLNFAVFVAGTSVVSSKWDAPPSRIEAKRSVRFRCAAISGGRETASDYTAAFEGSEWAVRMYNMHQRAVERCGAMRCDGTWPIVRCKRGYTYVCSCCVLTGERRQTHRIICSVTRHFGSDCGAHITSHSVTLRLHCTVLYLLWDRITSCAARRRHFRKSAGKRAARRAAEY